jgi:formate C-acetyltransferase
MTTITSTQPVSEPLRSGRPASPRLARLRQVLLDAPHRLCTQKAELLTEQMQRRRRPGWLDRPLSWVERAHLRAYARSLRQQVAGAPPPRWRMQLNDALMRLYLRLEGHDPSRQLVAYAEGLRHVLARMELRVYDDELLVGNLSSARVGAPIHPDLGGVLMLPELDALDRRDQNPIQLSDRQRRRLREVVFPYWFRRSVLAMTPLYCDDPRLLNTIAAAEALVLTQVAGISHLTPDYPKVLARGFYGIAQELAERERALTAERDALGIHQVRRRRELDRQLAFCRAGRITSDAVIAYGRRWQALLRAEARRTADGARRAELAELAAILGRVPARPARTFHEALQSIVLTHAAVHQESFQHGVSFGRMDQYLLPYYSADRRAGRIDEDRAVELLGCFLVKNAELLPLFFDRITSYFSGLSSAAGITLGGTGPDGTDATNELSHLFLSAYEQVRLRQPNLHVRVHPDSDPAFLERCYGSIKRGGGLPALFNEQEIIPALCRAGFAPQHAREFSVVGCAEWGVPHRSFPAAGAAFINLPYALLLALHDGLAEGRRVGPATGLPQRLTSIDAVAAAWRAQLRHLVRLAARGNNAIERAHADHRPTPLLSTLVEGCIASARDVTAGGARYNTAGMQGCGLADVADSLAAIELAVFEEGWVTLAELVRALDRNFEGDDLLRARLQTRGPKYGENHPRADLWARFVSWAYVEEVTRLRTVRGGPYAPGLWTMTTHQGFGALLGALPSGRLAGEPLASGVSPRAGWERRGPSAAMSSAAAVLTPANGCILNEKLDPALLEGERGDVVLDGLVRGFFSQGGAQVQINVVDPAVLRAARQSPERYRDLVVRVSGYSAYFNDLTEPMKDELIARTTHGCCE